MQQVEVPGYFTVPATLQLCIGVHVLSPTGTCGFFLFLNIEKQK